MTVAAFAEQLWPLADGLDEVFTDWLPRLRALFGSWRRPLLQDPTGDPDGFGGLARRGSWERLLTSEWAVADAVPDEFLRRAAMKEQLFLQLSRVVPTASPVTTVWLDCGPTQLGAPRLAHLAILVVLRRRSEEVGGMLSWSTLHAPDRRHEELDPTEVMKQRTLVSHRPRLEGEGERLVVGARCEGARAIEVREVSGGLEVVFDGRSVRLELPEPARVARWLSAPQRVERTLRPIQAPGIDALGFVAGGGVLLVRDQQRVFGFAVPFSRRETTKLRDADWENQGVLAGVGWHRQRLTTLRRRGDQAVFNDGVRLFQMPWPVGLEPAQGLPRHRVLPRGYNGPATERRTALLVRDARGLLHALDFVAGQAQPIGRARSDVWLVDGVLLWVGPDRLVRLRPGAQPPSQVRVLEDYGWHEQPEPIDEGQWFTAQGNQVLRAVRRGSTVYIGRIRPWGAAGDLSPIATDVEVVGPIQFSAHGLLQLVVRTERSLFLLPGRRVLAEFDAPIEAVALGGRDRPRIAVVVQGAIHVLDVHGDTLLRFVPGELL